jgi:hypothetical protein
MVRLLRNRFLPQVQWRHLAFLPQQAEVQRHHLLRQQARLHHLIPNLRHLLRRPAHQRRSSRVWKFHASLCRSGGIGRHVRLRGVWGNPWGFESPLRHYPTFGSKNLVSLCPAILAVCHISGEFCEYPGRLYIGMTGGIPRREIIISRLQNARDIPVQNSSLDVRRAAVAWTNSTPISVSVGKRVVTMPGSFTRNCVRRAIPAAT